MSEYISIQGKVCAGHNKEYKNHCRFLVKDELWRRTNILQHIDNQYCQAEGFALELDVSLLELELHTPRLNHGI